MVHRAGIFFGCAAQSAADFSGMLAGESVSLTSERPLGSVWIK